MSDKPIFYTGITEPESAANTDFQPKYPFNHVIQTDSGHIFEMDDTKGRERVRLNHRSGTFVEMHPNGDGVYKILGDGYSITLGDHNIIIGVDDGKLEKKLNIVVNGDVNMHVKGDYIQQVDGNFEQHVKGNYTQVVEGITSLNTLQDMHLTAGAFLGGAIIISTGASVHMNSDLHLGGELTANKITSTSRVDALIGMSAGVEGFVTLTGGLAVGVPVAVPQQIICSTNIFAGLTVDAGVSVISPLGDFGVMDAVLMTDIVNTSIYDTHIHISPKGPTGPPSPGPMI
jgi:hypothetical protein